MFYSQRITESGLTSQKYLFVILISLLTGVEVLGQCLSLPNAFSQQLQSSNNIIEGKVVAQSSFIGSDGNIYTRNNIDVYRVFKGDLGFAAEVVTEGGVYGDLMQIVTPSAQMQVGDYGVMVLEQDVARNISARTTAFYPINEENNTVMGFKDVSQREAFYDVIAREIGTGLVELRRIPQQTNAEDNSRNTPEISSIYPLQVTAGTRTMVTITGEGFGENQGSGQVAFHNADDGGQSFVSLNAGPHYLSWTDTEIQMYVPSATLYNTTVAGTGSLRVVADNGSIAESEEQLTIKYAKSEVIYSENLNETMLVGMQQGGYQFTLNQNMLALLSGSQMVENTIEKWACNTGINFQLKGGYTESTSYAHDQVNLLGVSAPNQLPSYLLGRTVTTFSSCGTPNGLQWNLIEVDILLNNEIDWWIAESQPMNNRFDLVTALLHELGHAHLLQHNNNESSPMYYQLTEGHMRRDLHAEADVNGGEFVAVSSVEAVSTCSAEYHVLHDFSVCDLSVINDVEESIEENWVVYPNPFTYELNVSGDWNNGAAYSMQDATGRLVQTGTLSSNQETLSTEGLKKGMYLLEVRFDESTFVKRLVKN